MRPTAIDPAFWRNKNVLLTGHTGFKGAWLSLWLAHIGARVTGVALPPPTKPSLFRAAEVDKLLAASVILDIRDRQKLVRLFKKVKPQIVIHMAAQPLVRASYLDPVLTYETNVMGTVNLLEATRAVSTVRAVVNVTTDKCYENIESDRGYREGDPLGGYDPYSSSKACAEIVTAAYRRSFFSSKEYVKHGVAMATARAGNVIGGGDWAKDRLVPDCIRSLMKGKDIILRHPQAVRPWQHVLEPLCGYLMLAQKLFLKGPAFALGWNFGPERKDVLTVKRVAELTADGWGAASSVKIAPGRHLHEAKLLMLDIRKAKKELGWKPCLSVQQALSLTTEWYQAWAQGSDMQRFSLKHIDDFQKRL